MDDENTQLKLKVKYKKDGTKSYLYTPQRSVKYTIIASYGGVAIPNSPFRVGLVMNEDLIRDYNALTTYLVN